MNVAAKKIDRYTEGLDYVVCPECGSHIILEDGLRVELTEHFDEYPDDQGAWIGFTCDWEPCLEDFTAWVLNPESP